MAQACESAQQGGTLQVPVFPIGQHASGHVQDPQPLHCFIEHAVPAQTVPFMELQQL